MRERKFFKLEDEHFYVYTTATQVAKEICSEIERSVRKKGEIVFIWGPQNSGKTLAAILMAQNLIKQDYRLVVAQPALNDSPDVLVYQDKLVSEYGLEFPAVTYGCQEQISRLFTDSDIVLIDEAQFTPDSLEAHLLICAQALCRNGGWTIFLGLFYRYLIT